MCSGLIHRNDGGRITPDTLEVAQRPAHRLADHDAGVLGGVVKIDMEVALRAHLEVDQRMTRQLFEHVIEKTDPGVDVVFAVTVEIERDEDIGLLGLALDSGGACFGVGLHGSGSGS